MNSAAKYHPYALRISVSEAKALTKAQKISGQSINQLVMLCVRRALPEVVSTFTTTSRVTNVNPLSAASWRKIYRRKDELHGVSAKQLAAFQSREFPE
jgi:uncharacterized protein (DUF1778 family)